MEVLKEVSEDAYKFTVSPETLAPVVPGVTLPETERTTRDRVTVSLVMLPS
jgi:hypothetical protein